MSKSLFDKVVGLLVCNFIKKGLQHRCFSLNVVKLLRTFILKKRLRTTASVNSRAAVFQESFALPFKRNGLISGICDLGKLV